MKVEKRSLNWLPRQSVWNESRAQAEKRRAAHSTFLDQQSSAANAFQSTRDNLAMGAAENSGQAAAARVKAEAKAAVSKLA